MATALTGEMVAAERRSATESNDCIVGVLAVLMKKEFIVFVLKLVGFIGWSSERSVFTRFYYRLF